MPTQGLPETEQPASAITVQGLQKSYKKLHVLRGVDFDVRRAASSPSSARTGRARPRS